MMDEFPISTIQDSLQSEVIGSYYTELNEAKQRARVAMEMDFANELEMFRRIDAAVVVQRGWRCYAARAELARRRAWAKVAVAGNFLGQLLYNYAHAREHRAKFLLHKGKIAAAKVLQRYARAYFARLEHNARMVDERKTDNETYRRNLLWEAAQAVRTLNHHYSIVDIAQVAMSKRDREPETEPEPEPEPEPEIEDTRSGELTPTPPAASRRRKQAGRPAGLCTGRARQRAGSVKAAMAVEGTSEARLTAKHAFRAAGQKVQSETKVSDIFSADVVRSAGTGKQIEQIEMRNRHRLTPRAEPTNTAAKARTRKSGSAKVKPHYLQHVEATQSNRDKLPALTVTIQGNGEVRPRAASARAPRTARGQPYKLLPLGVRARQ